MREARPTGRQVLADYFTASSHNDPQKSSFQSPSGTSSSRRISAGSCQKMPKRPVTPYPGIFCRELLCYQYFAAQSCLQPKENKDFTSKIRVGVPAQNP
jgi:hypothetical protein